MRVAMPLREVLSGKKLTGRAAGLSLAMILAAASSAAPAASTSPASSLPGAPPWAGHPAIVAAPAGGDSPGQIWLEMPSGGRAPVPAPPRARIVAAEALAAGWIAAGTEPAREGTEIVLLAGMAGRTVELPAPPRHDGGLRREPLPLVEDGRLAGLVWLEGATSRALAVRYAAWDGGAWRDEQLISAPGPGSQLALTAARLADGSWLLAWSAFDGAADQIVWSTRRGRAWTHPRPLTPSRLRSPRDLRDAQGPNITPDLAPLPASQGGGALIAWSRLEGAGQDAAYRVVTARFAGGRWEEPQEVGPAGSLYPTFVAAPAPAVLAGGAGGAGAAGAAGAAAATGNPASAGAGPAQGLELLYRNAAPGGWTVLDLAATGRPQRTAFLADAGHAPAATLPAGEHSRPVPAVGPGGVTFRWPAAGGEHFAPWSSWEPSR
jgi:hypothetical protein